MPGDKPTSSQYCRSLSHSPFSHEINEACAQGRDELTAQIILCLKLEGRHLFDIVDKTLLRQAKSLYGLSDSGDYWNVPTDKHFMIDLKIERAVFSVAFCSTFYNSQPYEITRGTLKIAARQKVCTFYG